MQGPTLWVLCLFSLTGCRLEGTSPTHAEGEKRVVPHSDASAAQAGPGAQAKDSAGPSGPQKHGNGVAAAHKSALEWLAAHQASDGSWGSTQDARVDTIGLTGLALLALQSDGTTPSSGPHAREVARGVQYLLTRQDAEHGLIGERVGHSFGYNHAIATQALCTALRGAPSESLREGCQNAVNFIARMRNPYGAWRYSYPPSGESDTSVTGWMIEALTAAKAAGLTVDPEAYVGAATWVDDVTDPATARVGYDAVGSYSSRVTGINDQFPTDKHEAMTASGMVTRMNAGQEGTPMLARHAELLRKRLPEWDTADKLVDEYYWYFGSLATHRMGGQDAQAWSQALSKALVGSQSKEGDAKGSWEPAGPWAYSGGEVYSTALNALSLSTML